MHQGRHLVVVMFLSALAACGGGGKSVPGSSPSPAPPAVSPTTPTFTVGGKASGIVGKVVLQNNGADDLAIVADGSFVFGLLLSAGSSFTVTVKEQPVASHCSLSNGTGVVGSANVDGIGLTCVPAPLSLLSSTIAAGATDVERNPDATLVFSTNIDASTATASNIALTSSESVEPVDIAVSGASITVTASHRLQGPIDYTLIVSTAVRGSGGERLAAQINLPFRTRDGRWGAPVLLESLDTGNASRPQIAMNTDGVAVAVWSQSDGVRSRIWFNRYEPGIGWSEAMLLGPASAHDAYSPDVGIDDQGNAIVVWHQTDSTSYNVWWSRLTKNTGFSNPQPLTSAISAGNARIAMSKFGDAVVVWSQAPQVAMGSRSEIWARRYAAAGGWGFASTLQSDFAFGSIDPQIAIEPNGNAIAVWAQSDGVRFHVWTNRASATGAWAGAQALENHNVGVSASLHPQVAIDPHGNAIAVWQQPDGVRTNIWASRLANGAWGSPTLLENDDVGPAFIPQIAVDAAGNAIVVWTQSGPAFTDIVARRFVAGIGWETPTRLETMESNAQTPQLAITEKGAAHVVWKQFRNSTRYDIASARYAPAGGWNDAKFVGNQDAGASQNSDEPQVAVDAHGNALAVWSRSESSRTDIWGNSFD